MKQPFVGGFMSCATTPDIVARGFRPSALRYLLRQEASRAIKKGNTILILSDRGVDADNVPIPALLATSAVHHHLIREGTRTKVGLAVETGEAEETQSQE